MGLTRSCYILALSLRADEEAAHARLEKKKHCTVCMNSRETKTKTYRVLSIFLLLTQTVHLASPEKSIEPLQTFPTCLSVLSLADKQATGPKDSGCADKVMARTWRLGRDG